MTVHVRVAGPTAPVMSALVREIRALDSTAMPEVTTMAAQINETLAVDRLMATLTVLFGLLGGALAAVGLYGVVAYTVAARTREIGIRIALGATHGRVLRQVVKESAVLTSLGIGVGLSGALWASRGVGSFPLRIKPDGPMGLRFIGRVACGDCVRRGVHSRAARCTCRSYGRVEIRLAGMHDQWRGFQGGAIGVHQVEIHVG